MDEIITKKPIQTISNAQPVTATDSAVHDRNKKKIVLSAIAIIVVIAVIIGGIFWYSKKHPKHSTPAQTLQALKTSSEPVVRSTQERAVVLSGAQKSSVPYRVTDQQQQQLFKALKN